MASQLFDLGGKTAVITGATRGIGRVIAQAFGEAGARLVIASENAADCASTEAELRARGFDTLAVPCDVTSKSDLEGLVEASERFGGSDVLVCNAGISGPAGPLHELDEVDYEERRSTYTACDPENGRSRRGQCHPHIKHCQPARQ